MPSMFNARDAGNYEKLMGRWSRRLAPLFIEHAGIADGEEVLEIGCGTGSLTFTLPQKAALAGLTAVDHSEIYLAADSIGTFNASAKAITVPTKNVSGASTTPDIIQADLTTAFKSLFTKSQLWIRLVANGSADPGVTPLQGKAVLTSLQVTVIISDKIF